MELAASGLRFQTQLRGSAQTGSLSRATRTLMANWLQTASTSGAGAAAGGSKRLLTSGYMPAQRLASPPITVLQSDPPAPNWRSAYRPQGMNSGSLGLYCITAVT